MNLNLLSSSSIDVGGSGCGTCDGGRCDDVGGIILLYKIKPEK